MRHDRHFGLASMLASIIAASSLFTFAATRAQPVHAADEPITTTRESNQPDNPKPLNSSPEVVANSENSTPGKPNTVTEARANETSTTAPEATSRVPIFLRALELPSLAKLTPLDKAYLDVFSILREDNNCSRFYGGSRAIEALNQLKLQLKTSYFDRAITLRMKGKTSYTTNNSSGLSYRLFEKAEVNANGAFYKSRIFPLDSTIARIGEYSPNTREARVTILLHEMGHIVLTKEDHPLLPNDGDDPMLSGQNTMRIIEVCRRQISEQSQISFERALAGLRITSDAKPSQLAVAAKRPQSAWTNISPGAP